MANGIKFFVGNWKMFGIPSSYKILNKINRYFLSDKKNNKKYQIVIAPPLTLLQDFSNRFKNQKMSISAQNCYHKDNFGAYTGNISPFMIKKLGVNYIIIGHSENRALGETNRILKEKVFLALKNNFTVIFCIGENKMEKKRKKTIKVLKNQISQVLKKKYNFRNIIIAYEPVWSIGSGKTPSPLELKKNSIILKKFLKQKFRLNYNPKLLYGGSVDKNNIHSFKSIKELDGFLIGGASKSSKNFVDIIKNFYK
tara:strand:- start:7792 stop:8553 length:762 start_codon:yes stop_codon:yes gene_type:complete